VGRRRKDGDPFGLAGTRIVSRRGKFYYPHRDGRWEPLGADLAVAKRIAARIRNPGEAFGTLAYWFGEFLTDCRARVKAGTMSPRTLADYEGYAADDGPLVAAFGKRYPEQITPDMVQAYLEFNANLSPSRPVPANRERAFLSSCISWLLRTGKVPGLLVNPCMRASGVIRNTERKRERYVTDGEYLAVFAVANSMVRLAMELVYRTLQRPEIDVLAWTPANVRTKEGQQVLRFVQSKTKRTVDIALEGRLGELVDAAIGPVPVLHQPLLHTLRTDKRRDRKAGIAYTYDGLSAMLKKAIAKARAAAKVKGNHEIAAMKSFGLRDLKGKGATDMWLGGKPIEEIQLLCGHADKKTTETYIKARWRATAKPNNTALG
jgi:integrase